MALKFYNDEGRLIACDDDACCIWTGKGWEPGTVELAREVWITRPELSRAAAARQFPGADLDSVPDMTEAKAKAEAGYDKNFDAMAEISRLGIEYP